MAQRTSKIGWSAGAIVLLGACLSAAAQNDPMEKHGGHPLANRRATLEELLDQPDWGPRPQPASVQPPAGKEIDEPAMAEPPQPNRPNRRPQADQMPAPPAVPLDAQQDVTRDLQAAIDERNRLVDRADLFDTINTILREEKELVKRFAVRSAALARQKQAADHVDMLNHPGANLVSPAAKADAMQAWRNAQARAQAADRAWQQQVNTLQPLYERVQPVFGPWMACYWRMRQAIQFDRRDPNRQRTLGVLEGAVRQRADFHEGRVLSAILNVYDGDAAGAEDHLQKACEGMAKYSLFGTPFANDCCYAYLLLGRTNQVSDFIGTLRKLDAGRQTVVRCWLVGLSGMISCKDSEAATYLQKALAKADVFKKDKDVPAEAAAILGDGALFRLTANNESQRNTDKAREILARARPEWNAWQLVRARAALAAADGNWADAVAQMDRCAEACPPSLADEVQAQRQAYAAQTPWFRSRVADRREPGDRRR